MSLASEPIWYHKLNLAGENTTLFSDWSGPWGIIRQVMDRIDYSGKTVVDIASFDGMWAFEAEERGAEMVFATDAIALGGEREFIARAYEKFLFAREKLGSKVYPYYNVSVHHLYQIIPFIGRKPDIIQHLGLLYHLENPWQLLKQCRLTIADGGTLILETAMSTAPGAFMRMNRGAMFYADDICSYWAPTEECLGHMIEACGFAVKFHEQCGEGEIVRRCLVAEAVPIKNGAEFYSDYRSL